MEIGSDFFWVSNENINVNWKRNWGVFFEATFLFLILFTEVLVNKKPHDKTTEKVKILLLTITILNTGNYRIIKRGLKNFAKKENFGTDKQSNKIQTKIQDKLYLQDLFGNSGYNDWFKWTKEKTFILNWTRTIELMNLRNLTMTIT